MQSLHMVIHNIKNIKHAVIEVPIKNGLFAIVGNNGSGKSTIISCLAQVISRHNLGLLRKEDFSNDSYVEFIYSGNKDHWYCQNGFWKADSYPNTLRYNGTYEGSLFYGMRFKDSKNVDQLMENGEIKNDDIVDADEYIVKKLGYILHNDECYYSGLKRIRNKYIAERLALKNTPYFRDVNGNTISQYRMSSGECLLISLLHFIYNSIIRRSLPTDKTILMLIDEIELALHPIAISNLIDFLKELTVEYENLTVIITSHAPEVIRRIEPNNIFKIECVDDSRNSIIITNPCYPSYAIRDVYTHDGFDYLLLVEDKLAKLLVQNAIKNLGLTNSRLINIIPVGGYRNVLDLQYELLSKNVLGVGKNVFSILDGDVKSEIKNKYKTLKKFFLPIQSIEKFLRKHIIIDKEYSIKKEINDTFFTVRSLDDIINGYKEEQKQLKETLGDSFKDDADGKKFYESVLSEIKKNNYSEEDFINKIYELIKTKFDLSSFNENLKKALT